MTPTCSFCSFVPCHGTCLRKWCNSVIFYFILCNLWSDQAVLAHVLIALRDISTDAWLVWCGLVWTCYLSSSPGSCSLPDFKNSRVSMSSSVMSGKKHLCVSVKPQTPSSNQSRPIRSRHPNPPVWWNECEQVCLDYGVCVLEVWTCVSVCM